MAIKKAKKAAKKMGKKAAKKSGKKATARSGTKAKKSARMDSEMDDIATREKDRKKKK
jgi:hypothetical protein